MITAEQVAELQKVMPDSTARVQHYSEYLKITGKPDDGETFTEWSKAAYLFVSKAKGNA
jgi:hypothetical protein